MKKLAFLLILVLLVFAAGYAAEVGNPGKIIAIDQGHAYFENGSVYKITGTDSDLKLNYVGNIYNALEQLNKVQTEKESVKPSYTAKSLEVAPKAKTKGDGAGSDKMATTWCSQAGCYKNSNTDTMYYHSRCGKWYCGQHINAHFLCY